MYNVLGESIQSNIVSSVKQSSFFSFQIVEGTECSNLTIFMVYIRYFNESGDVKSSFFSVKELQGCSNEMFNCIMSVLEGKSFQN